MELNELRKRAVERGERLLTDAVRKADDKTIARWVGSSAGMKVLFQGMARLYRPESAGDFRGDLQFTLQTPRGPESWTITATDHKARARRGTTTDPKVEISTGVADFIRIGLGIEEPFGVMLSGRLIVKGDLDAAMRLGEMFGGRTAG